MKYLSVILLSGLLAACGASSEQSSNAKAASNNTVNANVRPGVVSNGNANEAPSGTPDMTGIPSNPNASSQDANSAPAGSIEAANRGRNIVEGPPPPPGSKPPTVPAGDDSAVSSEMLKDGTILEKRVFGQNEYLKALEIRTKGRARSASVILRNGKTVKVAADRIPNIGSPSASFLMELAGIKPKTVQPEQPGTSSKGAKPTR
ncbi:MAG: hypothetical protein R2682_14480 [Pyrinomonadaceae bacterium]